MGHLSPKAIKARIAEQKRIQYRTWRPNGSYASTVPSPFVIVQAYDQRDCDTVHRLDCPELQCVRDRGKRLLFVRRFQDLDSIGQRTRHITCQCQPRPDDTYYQCLVCGTFIPGLPKKFNATCQCGRLTVDPMAPIGPDSLVTVTCAPGEYRFLLPRGVTIRKLKK